MLCKCACARVSTWREPASHAAAAHTLAQKSCHMDSWACMCAACLAVELGVGAAGCLRWCGRTCGVCADAAGSPCPSAPVLEPTLQSALEPALEQPPVECARGSIQGQGSKSASATSGMDGMTGSSCGVAARQECASDIGISVASMSAPGFRLESLDCPAPVDARSSPDDARCAPADVHMALVQNGSTCGDGNVLLGSEIGLRCTRGDVTAASSGATRNAWHRRAACKARACCSRAARMLRGCFGC
jgi:hypothetical protein